MKFTGFMVLGLCVTGCASNLAMMQTARTLEPGQLKLGGGVGWYIPATQIANFAGDGVAVAQQGIEAGLNKTPVQLTDAQKRSIALHSIALAAMPPSPSLQVDARLGVLPRFDVGMRYSIDSVRADAKFNFFHDGVDDPEDGLPRRSKDIAIGLVVSKQLFNPAVGDAMGTLRLDGFDRWDFEVPLYVSIDVSRYFGVYGGGRYRFSFVGFDQHVTQMSPDCGCGSPSVPVTTTTRTKFESHFYGATAGFRVGSARFSWMLEMTLGYTNARTQLLGQVVQLGGITLYPATGIALTF